MECFSCRSSSFYEDDNGNMCCNDCGTQSQDYLPETFDQNDNPLQLHANAKFIQKKFSLKRKRLVRSDAEVIDFLEVYQYSLRLIAQSICNICGISTHKQFIDMIGDFWFNYLNAWSCCSYSMIDAFSRHTDEDFDQSNFDYFSGDDEVGNLFDEDGSNKKISNKHPLYPSKPLMLGFAYLAIRTLRLGIIPADLVRWCLEGKIPYNSLWEIIPFSIKSKLASKNKYLFHIYHSGKTKIVSTTNIFFHTVCLSKTLKLSLPSLNAPLIARNFITFLGLPQIVWIHFIEISQILSNSEPISTLNCYEQNYPEQVMAAVLVACKMTRGWSNWRLVRNNNMNNNDDDNSNNNRKKSNWATLRFRFKAKSQKGGIVRGQTRLPTCRLKSSQPPAPPLRRDPLRASVAESERAASVPMPATLADLDDVPRSDLLELVTQIRRSVPHYKASINSKQPGQFKFNKVVRKCLLNCSTYSVTSAAAEHVRRKPMSSAGDLDEEAVSAIPAAAVVEAEDDDEEDEEGVEGAGMKMAPPNPALAPQREAAVAAGEVSDGQPWDADLLSESPFWSQYARYSSAVGMNGVKYCGRSALDDLPYAKSDRSLLNAMNLEGVMGRRYLTYARFDTDCSKGLLHMAYTTLLERAGKHLFAKPGLLHQLLLQIELEMIGYADRKEYLKLLKKTDSRAEHAVALSMATPMQSQTEDDTDAAVVTTQPESEGSTVVPKSSRSSGSIGNISGGKTPQRLRQLKKEIAKSRHHSDHYKKEKLTAISTALRRHKTNQKEQRLKTGLRRQRAMYGLLLPRLRRIGLAATLEERRQKEPSLQSFSHEARPGEMDDRAFYFTPAYVVAATQRIKSTAVAAALDDDEGEQKEEEQEEEHEEEQEEEQEEENEEEQEEEQEEQQEEVQEEKLPGHLLQSSLMSPQNGQNRVFGNSRSLFGQPRCKGSAGLHYGHKDRFANDRTVSGRLQHSAFVRTDVGVAVIETGAPSLMRSLSQEDEELLAQVNYEMLADDEDDAEEEEEEDNEDAKGEGEGEDDIDLLLGRVLGGESNDRPEDPLPQTGATDEEDGATPLDPAADAADEADEGEATTKENTRHNKKKRIKVVSSKIKKKRSRRVAAAAGPEGSEEGVQAREGPQLARAATSAADRSAERRGSGSILSQLIAESKSFLDKKCSSVHFV